MSDSSGSRRRRRRSKDIPPRLSERLQLKSTLQNISEHQSALKKSQEEFTGVLSELEEVAEMNDKLIKRLCVFIPVQVVCSVVAVGVFVAPSSGYMSLAVAAATIAAFFGISIVFNRKSHEYKNKINTVAEKKEKLAKEIQDIAKLLEKDLENVKSLGEKARETLARYQAALQQTLARYQAALQQMLARYQAARLLMLAMFQAALQQFSGQGNISGLLQGNGLADSVGLLKTRQEEFFTDLTELKSVVEAY